MSFDGRIGIAFHRTLEALSAEYNQGDGAEAAAWAHARFRDEIQAQEAEADTNPRERLLPRNPVRVAAATEALLVAAHRMANRDIVPSGTAHSLDAESEIDVESRDGLFRGRVDRAEHGPGGTYLIDYKSALRDDLPDRYERQLQLYASMWHDTRETWPVGGAVVYPLVGRTHEVPLVPELCASVAADAAELVREAGRSADPAAMARPGEVCQVCAYRPWCQPFWDSQAAAPAGAALERARYGLEGRIEAVSVSDSAVRLSLTWGSAQVEVVAPPARFPQLLRAGAGDIVRVLDTGLTGLRHKPRARVSEKTEIFLVSHSHRSE